MANSTLVKLSCALILCIVMVSPFGEAAITCGQVSTSLAPCMSYLKGGSLAGTCCPGVKKLVGLAKSSADKKTACTCLKSASGNIPGVNYNLAAGLPAKCGVSIPYAISPNTDCSKVH